MPLAIMARKRAVTKSIGTADISRIVPYPGVFTPIAEPWVAAVGDCFFFRLCEEAFAYGSLHPDDCPAVICYPRGRIAATMDVAEQVLPRSLETLFVHLGSNDLSSPSSDPEAVAAQLEERLWRLQSLLPRLRTVVICLLTPRTTDLEGRYDHDYIQGCNQRMSRFNALVLAGRIRGVAFTVRYLDFYLSRKNLPFFLRVTGFGLNCRGRTHIAGIIEKLILNDLRLQRCSGSSSGPTLNRGLPALPGCYGRDDECYWNYWNYRDWPVPGQQQQQQQQSRNYNWPTQNPSTANAYPRSFSQWQWPRSLSTTSSTISDYRPASIGSTFSDLSTLSAALSAWKASYY